MGKIMDSTAAGTQNQAIRSVALWATLYIAVQIGIHGIRSVNPDLLSLIATFPFMFLWLMVISSVAQLKMGLWETAGGFLLFGAGVLIASSMGLSLVVNFLLMFSGAFLGYLVATLIRERNILLPVAIVAAIVDTWGVYFGTTHLVLQHYSGALGTISAGVTVGHEVGPLLRVGFGDFVFLGLFLTAIQRLKMNFHRTFILLYTMLTAALVLVFFLDIPIPALVPMGLAVIAANAREFRLSRQEWFALLYLGILIYATLAAFLLTRYFSR